MVACGHQQSHNPFWENVPLISTSFSSCWTTAVECETAFRPTYDSLILSLSSSAGR